MSQFKVIVTNKAENTQWELPYQSAEVSWNLNDVHTANIYIDGPSLIKYIEKQGSTPKDVLVDGWRNIYIYQDDTLIFAGYIADVMYQKYERDFNVQVGVKSWLGYFENRIYTGSFTNTDQGSIAWQVINAVNDIGITMGTIDATKNRDRTYSYDDVRKVVRQLTIDEILEGYEFDITNAKVFTAKARIGQDRPNIIFDEYNIMDYTSHMKTVGGVFNRAYILGGNVGDEQIIRNYDAGSTYTDDWYRLETVINDINVQETDNLDDKVEKFVDIYKSPITPLSMKVATTNPASTAYGHGDGVRVRLPDAEIDAIRRIRKKTLYFGDNEYISLEFTHD